VIQRLGDRALRMPRPRGKSATALLEAARAWPGVVDAWLTEAWLAVELHRDATTFHASRVAALAAVADEDASPAREHVIAVRYDGADLEDVARACGTTPEAVAALHSRAKYTVLFVGFLPGFAYLGGLPRELEVPRLEAPRVRVPKNAVAIGGPYAGVYPFESPGGWRLIGTAVDAELFDLERGALFRPGDAVRFREVR
jgi:KipI family sensor histidine kinase inhibitor